MKYIVQDHSNKPSDREAFQACKNGEWTYSREDLLCRGVIHYLYVEEDLTNTEIEAFLSERVDEPITLQDVKESLRWFGYVGIGRPPQATNMSLADRLSFGFDL